jgi:hypothetical protein
VSFFLFKKNIAILITFIFAYNNNNNFIVPIKAPEEAESYIYNKY